MLELWQRPKNYAGATYYDYYPLVGQHRDSDALTRANFKAAQRLFPEAIVARASHWLVGWVETLLLHKNAAPEVLKRAEEMLEGLEQYPVVDEDELSQEEEEAAAEVWRDCFTNWGRLAHIREYREVYEFRDFADLLNTVRGNHHPYGNCGYELYYHGE